MPVGASICYPPRAPEGAVARRLQIQIDLPYHREPKDDERVRRYLDAGWRIGQLQRLTDREVVITFEAD